MEKSIFTKIQHVYSKYGYDIRTGLNPIHFPSKRLPYIEFTYLKKNNDKLFFETGGGISPIEIYLLQSLSGVYNPSRIFIIGNAFGWSTIALALCFPNAKIVVIDAGIDGKDNMAGIHLTNEICKKEKLNCIVEYGFSPENTENVIKKHFNDEKIDLIFIDGLHTNEQVLKDFYGVLEFCHSQTIFLYHDIVLFKMEQAFLEIKKYLKDYDSHILHRTTSGMGVSIPNKCHQDIHFVFKCFSEKKETIDVFLQPLSTKVKIRRLIIQCVPPFTVILIKKLIRFKIFNPIRSFFQ